MKNKDNFFILLLIFAMAIWGGNWVVSKTIAASIPLPVIVFWRFFLTTLAFFPVMYFFKQSFKISSKGFIFALITALFMVLYNHFFFAGLKRGFAGAGGLLVTTLNPLFTFTFTAILFKEKAKPLQFAGLALGLTGGAILLGLWKVNSSMLLKSGNFLFILASISWCGVTIGSNKSKNFAKPLTFSFYVYTLSTIMELIYNLPQYHLFIIFQQNFNFWIALFYASVITTVFATTVFMSASTKIGSNKTSSFVLLVPTTALFFSWLFLKETLEPETLIGGTFSMIAVYLINKGKSQKILKKRLVRK